MDTTLLALLLASLAFAALLAYFILYRREYDIGGRGRAGIFIILFVITPVLVIAMVLQAGADTRLQQAGFMPHPSFGNVSGIAAGLGGEPYWVFESTAGPDDVLDYYRRAENHPDWILVRDSGDRLIFEQDEQRMLVSMDDRKVFFTMLKSNRAPAE